MTRSSAQCPTYTDNGVGYKFVVPALSSSTDTGTLVVMSDGNSAVTVGLPRCSPSTVSGNPAAGSPMIVEVCANQQWPSDGQPASSDYEISIARTDSAVATLHAVFKSARSDSEDAMLLIPTDPDQHGSSYWSMGMRGSTGRSRWIAYNPNGASINVEFKDCTSTATSATVSADRPFQQLCDTSLPNTNINATGFNVMTTGGEKFHFASGATCAQVPAGTISCEVLMEEFPQETWFGTEYLVTEFNKHVQPIKAGDLVRIMTLTDSTTVTVEAATGGALSVDASVATDCPSTSGFTLATKGDWCDVHIKGGARITVGSGKRLTVGQFAKGTAATECGDPAFVLVTPLNHPRCSHRFFSFTGFNNDANDNGTYVNIVAPSSLLASVKLDGIELTGAGTKCLGYSKIDYASGGYSWTKCRLADPSATGDEHTVDGNGNPVFVYPYGQKDYGAYAYPAGLGF